jgi:hypothetical protein
MYRFSFNLLPQKSKEVIEKEEERESTSLYIAFLPLFAVIVGVGFILFNQIIVENSLSNWEAAIQERDNTIQSFRTDVAENLEFAQKTELLLEPVQKDVDPEKFFTLSELLLTEIQFPAVIESYGRSANGAFDLTISFDDIYNAASIVRTFEQTEQIKLPNTESLKTNLFDESAEIAINFFIIEEEEQLASE